MSASLFGRKSADESSVDRAAESPAFEWLARAGFVARGLIYGIIGVLALKLAMDAGGKTTDQKGALREVAHQPFGKVLLILVAIGLAGYSIWRLTRAVVGHGAGVSDEPIDRVAAFASGLVYAGMCLLAIAILLGSSAGQTGSPKTTTRGVLGWPGGPWLVGIAGVVFVGIGLYQGYKGVTKDFLEDSKTEEMSSATRRWISGIGIAGHLARTVVFCLVGVFLVKAAVQYDPTEAVGIDGALATLQRQSYGQFLLGLVAAGLIAFAVYSFSDARYRRI